MKGAEPMEKRNLQQWMSLCTGGLSGNARILDRYVELSVTDIWNFLGDAGEENRTMPPEKTDSITVLNQVENTMDTVLDEDFFMKEQYGEREFPPDLYALMVAPFAEWILQTEYGPELEFLLKTEINLFE